MFSKINKTGTYNKILPFHYDLEMVDGTTQSIVGEFEVLIEVDMDYGSDADGNRGLKEVWVSVDDIRVDMLLPKIVEDYLRDYLTVEINKSTYEI